MIYRKCWQHLYQIERRRIPPTPEGDLRLHRLERPVPWSDRVWPQADHIERYSFHPPLIARLADWLGVLPSQIVLGAGIESLVRDLIMLSCDPGDGFAYTWPTCMMFDVYAQVFRTSAHRIVTRPDVELSIADVANAARTATKLVLLPNPGQPVETCFSQDDLAALAWTCHKHDCVLAIDEAYYGFGAPTALPLISEFDNVVVLRTFSKAFGAAGIRVGYAVGQSRVIQPLEAVRLSGEIAGPSQRAAERLMAMWPSEIQPGIKQIVAGRNWLRDKLNTTPGMRARGQWANHVLVELPAPNYANTMYRYLQSRGIHVKGDFPPPLDRHLLITAAPIELMQKVYDVTIECLAEVA